MKDFMSMMKQAKELQSRMAEMQKQLGDLEINGQSGAGLVTVTLNGKGDLKAVKIDPSLAKPDELEILEDLIVAAHTDGKAKLENVVKEKMQMFTGDLPLPPGMKPF
jgi:hypothetical protein